MPDVREGVKSFLQDVAKQCDRNTKAHLRGYRIHQFLEIAAGLPVAILSVIASASFFANRFQMAAGILSLIVAALAAARSFLKPDEKAAFHQRAANAWANAAREIRAYIASRLPLDSNKELQNAVTSFTNGIEKAAKAFLSNESATAFLAVAAGLQEVTDPLGGASNEG